MSDKITELNMEMEPEPMRRLTVKKLVILGTVVLAVCGVLCLFLFNEELNLDGLLRWGKYLTVRDDERFGSYSFDSHSSNCYASFDDGLAVASISGLTIFDENGQERSVLQQQIDIPKLLSNDEIALVFDVGGLNLVALHEENGEVLHLEETHPILDADLSADGAVCVSSSASGYKSVLAVYNEEQDLIYRWLSSTTYFPLCAITEDGTDMAAISVGQKDGVYESSICFFRTDSEQIQKTVSLGSQLIYDLVFVSSDLLCAIGETSVQYVSLSGEQLGAYVYDSRYLKQFDCGGDGFLALAMNMYRAGNRYSLITIEEESGQVIGDLYIGEEVLDISACDRYIAVLTPGKLTVYTRSLSQYSQTTDVADATSVVMREDGSVLLLGGGKGSLYIP